MKIQKGFAPIMLIFLILVGGASLTYGGYLKFHKKLSKTKSVGIVTPTVKPSPTIISLPTPTKIIIPKETPLPPSTVSPSILFRIDDNGLAIVDPSLSLNIKDENSGKEQTIKNESSGWLISDLNSGKYKFSITFPKDRYFNPQKNCEGCKNVQDISNFDTCGYVFDFNVGDNIKIYCMLRSTQPLPDQSSNTGSTNSTDSTPPTTNVNYPSNNGTLSYKMDGKVCAIASPPTDNVSGTNEIETEYKFDDGGWSGYSTGRAYLCTDSLSNGPHTLSYHSKDKAGNVENTKNIQFTVNIVGN